MMLSPLRYPGGKSDFFSLAAEIFVGAGFSGMPVVEPFAGSAAVSLGLLDFGLTPHVTIVEKDPLLYCFWCSVFSHTSELISRFQDLSISLKTWEEFQKYLRIDVPNGDNVVDLGLAGLFFNRANFSGILNAGPIGGKGQKSDYKIDCRTNKDDIIVRILTIATLADRVDVVFGDAAETVRQQSSRKNTFFYLDPPYFKKGELLYRHFYKLAQHKELASVLAEAEFNWLLSYDDHHVIEFLYQQFNLERCEFRYSARSHKNHNELLISNFALPWGSEVVIDMPRRQRHRTAFSSANEAMSGLLA